MKRIRRSFYRFRAKIYGRLPRNKSIVKLGIILFVAFLLVLVWRVKQLFHNDTDKEAVVTASGYTEIVEETGGTIMENGYLPTEYLPAGISKKESSNDLDVAVKTTSGGTVIKDNPIAESNIGESINSSGLTHSISGFVPIYYPVLSDIIGTKYLLKNMKQLDYLEENFYIVNATTKITEQDFHVEKLLAVDLSIEKKELPQILIYHSHASEAFADSRYGVSEDSVVGIGKWLAYYLTEKYGYQVIHDTTVFDRKEGKDNRSYAYNDALPYVEAVLKQYPSIEVIIDLHRDSGAKRVTTIQGKQVAKVMLFNGLSRNQSGEISYLPNKNLAGNLAFSLQTKLIGDEMYPGLMHRIFLKDYRYNMHLAERYLLIELGTVNNTVEEARNAMEPLADVLAQVLSPNEIH